MGEDELQREMAILESISKLFEEHGDAGDLHKLKEVRGVVFPAHQRRRFHWSQAKKRSTSQRRSYRRKWRLMPYCRQISLTVHPASASFRIDTIWVSVNFDCRMGTSWLRVAILPECSPYGCLRLRGAYKRTSVSERLKRLLMGGPRQPASNNPGLPRMFRTHAGRHTQGFGKSDP